MNIRNIHFFRNLVLALALFLATVAHAQLAPAAAGHLETVKRMLHATKVGELLAYGMHEALKKRQASEKTDLDRLVNDVLAKMSPEAAVNRLVPIYARYLSQAEAQAIAVFFESPAGQKFINKLLAEKTMGGQLPDVSYTAADVAAINRFEKTEAAQAWVSASSKSGPEIKKSMEDWGKEMMAARLASDPAASGVLLGASKAGQQLTGIVRKYMARSTLEEQKFSESLLKFEKQSVLSPEKLVSAGAIAESNRAIDDMEKTIEDYLVTLGNLQKDMRAEIAAIELRDEIREEFDKGFEKGLARGLSLRLRFAETQRTGISLFRRMLQFAESRLGSIRLDGGKQLVFERNEDLETYRSLVTQFRQLTTEEENIHKEALATREKLNSLVAGAASTQPSPAEKPDTETVAASRTDAGDPAPQQGYRQHYVTVRTAGPVFSGYVTRLLERLKQSAAAERNGPLRGSPAQEAVLTISISSTGHVNKVTVNHSSGDKNLDDALVNLVRRNSPFGAFSDDMKKQTDLLLVTGAL